MSPRPGGQQRLSLLAVCGGTFMLLVDVTIVQVALPTMQRHLHASFGDLQWVIDAYALVLAAFILTSGALADRYGRKRLFLFGVVVFTVASLLCGVSTGMTMVIWSRALQGIGGAAMFATGLALIGQDFTGLARARAIAVWGATVGAAVAVGPLLGGVLTDGLGWRWIFFVNVPIGVVTLLLAQRAMRNVADPDASALDVTGLVLFSGALFLLVFGLIRGNELGWSSPAIVAVLAGSAVVLGAFVVAELRHERPMFDLSLFRRPSFTGVSVGTFAIGAGMFGLLPYFTLYLQNDLGYSPLQGGLRLLPSTVLCFVVPLLLRNHLERLTPGPLLGGGLAITAIGVALIMLVAPASGWTALLPGLVVTGLGIGVSNPAIARIGLGVVPPQRTGMASGLSNTFRVGGLATGVAAWGAIFQDSLQAHLQAQLHRPAAGLARNVAAAGFRHGTSAVVGAVSHAFASGIDEIALVAAVVVFAGAIAAAVMIRRRDFHPLPSSSTSAHAAPMTPSTAEVAAEAVLGG
ncbi:MAG: MFS transporter [Acidimicrobiales bacterium]